MIRKGLLLILLLVSTISTFATHLRGGYITIDHVQGNTYKITLIVYVKTIGRGTNVLFSHDDSGILNFGDNSKIKVTQQEGEPRLDLDPSGDISEVVYSVNHEYTKGGTVYHTKKQTEVVKYLTLMTRSIRHFTLSLPS